jgi:GDP-L-fucose synthase
VTDITGRKFLVTGGTGFIGGALVRRLIDMGASVRATHFTRAPPIQHAALEWLRADLREEVSCQEATNGIDCVLHCAAVTSGAADITSSPLMHVTPNVVLNARIMEAAYRAGVKRFVFISSAAAYPPRGTHPLAESEMFDADPADVYYPAGWMKRYAEVLCRMYAEKLRTPMAALVVRPSNVYGPGDKFEWQRSHVTAALVRRVVERHRPIVVWGTGQAIRDVIYIDDFVNGVLAALSVEAPFLAVNIGAGRGCTIAEILRTALEVDGFIDADVQFDISRPTTIKTILVDVSLARRLFAFEALTPLATGLRKTAEWLRANPAKTG